MFWRKNKSEQNQEKGEEQTMDDNKKSTLEMVREAYANLSDEEREEFHQDIADRIHESVAAQEHDDHEEDSQSAEDREHEAIGAEHADEREEAREEAEEHREGNEEHGTEEEGSESEPEDTDGAQDDSDGGETPAPDPLDDVRAELGELRTMLQGVVDRLDRGEREPKETDERRGSKLDEATRIYNT